MTSKEILKDAAKEDLRDLLNEIKEIGENPAPAKVKQSSQMRKLFASEHSRYTHWMDTYIAVEAKIKNEILGRVSEGWM